MLYYNTDPVKSEISASVNIPLSVSFSASLRYSSMARFAPLDASILAAVKPQGMPAQPDLTGDRSFLEEMEAYTGQPLGLLHRLDRPVGVCHPALPSRPCSFSAA